jgi:hypothetical protein
MRSGLDLDDSRNAVLLDAGHHTGEPVPCRLLDGRAPLFGAALCLEPADVGESYEALAAGGPADP